jgi:hypothetical protein
LDCFAQIVCSEGDGCALIDHESRVLDESAKHDRRETGNLHDIAARKSQSPAQGWAHLCNLGDLLMRSKLAISALVVALLFGSTHIASAQSQPAPGASSEGNISPGATSGKKTKHEKGMTTGSSRHSGAHKGDAANPSDQDSSAGPKGSGKY